MSDDHLQWIQRTDRLVYEWLDKDGNTRTSAWSKAVRNAMRPGGAEFLRQRAVTRAAGKWNKQYLRDTDVGVHQLKQTAMEVLDTVEWNWQCMTQLQEAENRTSPAATTWAAEFLLRPGESREILGQWMSSNAIHENKKRRATQIVTGSFPCRKWLHKLYSHIRPFCELCRKEREASGQPTDNTGIQKNFRSEKGLPRKGRSKSSEAAQRSRQESSDRYEKEAARDMEREAGHLCRRHLRLSERNGA